MNAKSTDSQELQTLFQKQKDAFQKNMYPSYTERIEALKTLESMVRDSRWWASSAVMYPPYGAKLDKAESWLLGK